jgi:hypothetical protein
MYSKQQIEEAGKMLVSMLDKEDFDPGYVDMVSATIDDLLQILDGKLKPAWDKPEVLEAKAKAEAKRDVILVPGMGFVPVLGAVWPDEKLGNRIEWFGEDE